MGSGKIWATIGVAGLLGVAGTGVAIVRQERARRAYTPDEVRERLHERYARNTDDNRDD